MILSDDELIKLMSSPRNQAALSLARNQEELMIMHCESIQEKYNIPAYAWMNFQNWWQGIITKEKHDKINSLITTPLATTPLTEEIFTQIGKFRDAQDRYVSFNFTTEDFTNDFEAFLDRMNDDTFWRDTCMEGIKTGICDFLVIDLPAVQNTERPEPYQYLVSPSNIFDVDINKFNGNTEYIIFRQNKIGWDDALQQISNFIPTPNSFVIGEEVEKCIAVDDESYRVMVKGKATNWTVISKSEHGLGYCPVIDFWQPSIKGSNGINKKGILTNLYSKLNMYLFYMSLVQYMDIYGAFPIFVTYAMEDEEFDSKRKEVNWNDYYNPQTTSSYGGTTGSQAKNPRTNYIWMGAPGSVMQYAQPVDGSDANFVKDHPRFINMPTDALKHVNDRGLSLKNEIIQFATGENKDYLNEIAKNSEMMDASFNKQDTILTFVKRQIERIHRFSIKTRCELRYGKEYFVGCTVDYGSDFVLKDAGRIVEEFEQAVKAGMPPEYTMQIAKEAGLTRFKNNKDILARQRIISDLIPYQNMSITDMVAADIPTGDTQNFVLRINSTNFISQFELEFGDIVKFAQGYTYSQKISLIKKQLQKYGAGIQWRTVEPSANKTPEQG